MSNTQIDIREEEKLSPRPPAILQSKEGDYAFSLAILGWESTVIPCTRYDEWIICSLSLKTPGDEKSFEGPFMLRHEVVDLKGAIEKCILPNEYTFQSDFMETVFKINLQSLDSHTTALISLKSPESKQDSIHAQFQAEFEQLSNFVKGLERQLEDFYSVL